MARLFADENFPLPVVEGLRHLGHDVVTMHDAGKAGQAATDEAVLDFARADNRSVLTLIRKHFVRLHASGRAHAGIIACTFDLDFPGQTRRIHALIAANVQFSGQLLRVNRPS